MEIIPLDNMTDAIATARKIMEMTWGDIVVHLSMSRQGNSSAQSYARYLSMAAFRELSAGE